MDPELIIQKLDELTRKVDTLIEADKNELKSDCEWMDNQETMEILKCSPRTLQKLRDTVLNHTNPLGGTKFFYLRKDVIDLFEKNFNGKIKTSK
jgi:hypothetical protein